MHEIHVDGKHVHACYLAECSNCASGCEFAEVPAFPPDRIRDVQEELSAFVVVFYFEGKAVAYDRGVPLIVQYGIRYSFCAGSQIGEYTSILLDLKSTSSMQTEMRIASLQGAIVEDRGELSGGDLMPKFQVVAIDA